MNNLKKKRNVLTFILAAIIIFSSLATTTTANAETSYGYCTITANNVNYRSGPATYYPSYGQLHKGTKVLVYGFYGEVPGETWVKIGYKGQKAYVNNDYCDAYH